MHESKLVVDDPQIVAADEAVGIIGPPVEILDDRVEEENAGRDGAHCLGQLVAGRPDREPGRAGRAEGYGDAVAELVGHLGIGHHG